MNFSLIVVKCQIISPYNVANHLNELWDTDILNAYIYLTRKVQDSSSTRSSNPFPSLDNTDTPCIFWMSSGGDLDYLVSTGEQTDGNFKWSSLQREYFRQIISLHSHKFITLESIPTNPFWWGGGAPISDFLCIWSYAQSYSGLVILFGSVWSRSGWLLVLLLNMYNGQPLL